MLLRLDRDVCLQLLGSIKAIFEREASRRAREAALVEQVLGKLDWCARHWPRL